MSIVDDDVSVNDVVPESFGFTLEDDIAALNTDEPIVVAGRKKK